MTRGDAASCGWETGKGEVCGDKPIMHVAGTVEVRKGPTTSVMAVAQVDEFLCLDHAHLFNTRLTMGSSVHSRRIS